MSVRNQMDKLDGELGWAVLESSISLDDPASDVCCGAETSNLLPSLVHLTFYQETKRKIKWQMFLLFGILQIITRQQAGICLNVPAIASANEQKFSRGWGHSHKACQKRAFRTLSPVVTLQLVWLQTGNRLWCIRAAYLSALLLRKPTKMLLLARIQTCSIFSVVMTSFLVPWSSRCVPQAETLTAFFVIIAVKGVLSVSRH